MKNIFKTILISITVILVSCDTEDELIQERIDNNPPPSPPTVDWGEADFSTYVAIGNSLTAGFMDAALYNNGQQNSFPLILAQQLYFGDDPDFNQPDIKSLHGFNTAVPNPDPQTGAILGKFILDTSIPGPVPTTPGDLITPYSGDKNTLHNFGVPGILVGQLLIPETGGPDSELNPAYNPFYARFATAPGTSTILGDVIARNPSFFTLWIGNNDVLGYALSGASNETIFTSTSDFDTQFNAVIGQLLTNTSANGVVINIPPILAIPFFQAVPWNPIPLDQATADALNAGFAGYNQVIDALFANGLITQEQQSSRKISFTAGQNPVVIVDEDIEDFGPKFDQLESAGAISSEERQALVPFEQVRQTTSVDLIPLSTAPVLGVDLGSGPLGLQVPLEDKYIITGTEQEAIIQRSIAFNTTIATAAAQNSTRLAIWDTNAVDGPLFDIFGLSDGEIGLDVEGQTLMPDFSPNGVFSTDGIHPNPRGNALIVNEVIKVIELQWNAQIPEAEVLDFRSVIFK